MHVRLTRRTYEGSQMNALARAIPLRLRNWVGRKRVQLGRKMLWADMLTNFSKLRRVTPYRPAFGWYRGQCIDRFYIEKFLSTYSSDIRGRVLEVAEPVYANQFGGSKVSDCDVVDADPRNQKATLIADLCSANNITEDTYNCIICTQTLLCIYDFHAAIRTMHRILKPGGVLLCTFPGIAQLSPRGMLGAGDDYWRFTRHSAKIAFGSVFCDNNVIIETYGNVLTAVAMLHGLVSKEFSRKELEYHDSDYEVTIGVRAMKSAPTV